MTVETQNYSVVSAVTSITVAKGIQNFWPVKLGLSVQVWENMRKLWDPSAAYVPPEFLILP